MEEATKGISARILVIEEHPKLMGNVRQLGIQHSDDT